MNILHRLKQKNFIYVHENHKNIKYTIIIFKYKTTYIL